MKLTTLFFAFVNYAYNKKGRRTGKATLFHALRLMEEMALKQKYLTKSQELMLSKNEVEIEWDSSLSHTNLIDTPEGIVPLDNFSQEQRAQILHDILLPDMMNSAQAKLLLQNKARSKNKLTTWIKKGDLCAQGIKLVNMVLANPDTIDLHHFAGQFNSLDMKRKIQRVEQLANYIRAHNALVDKPKSLNCINFEELLFKIPIRNEIGTDTVSREEMMNTMKGFLKHYYPDYPIKLLILHDDERLPDEQTGAHVHAFISGKNAVTNEHDLRLAHIKNVNAFLFDQQGSDAHLFSEEGKLIYEQAGDVAGHLQQVFYQYVNEHLFHPKNINAAFHPESVRKSEKRKQMRREAKLAKRDRPLNFASRLREHISGLEAKFAALGLNIKDSRTLLDKLTHEVTNMTDGCYTVTQNYHQLQLQCQTETKKYQKIQLALLDSQLVMSKKKMTEYALDERLSEKAGTEKALDTSISLKNRKNAELDASIGLKTRTNAELDTAITEKQSMLDKLSVMTVEALQPLHQMLERMHKRLIVDNRAGAIAFMGLVLKAFTADLPSELRSKIIGVTLNTGDIELKEALTRKDREIKNSEINDPLDM